MRVKSLSLVLGLPTYLILAACQKEPLVIKEVASKVAVQSEIVLFEEFADLHDPRWQWFTKLVSPNLFSNPQNESLCKSSNQLEINLKALQQSCDSILLQQSDSIRGQCRNDKVILRLSHSRCEDEKSRLRALQSLQLKSGQGIFLIKSGGESKNLTPNKKFFKLSYDSSHFTFTGPKNASLLSPDWRDWLQASHPRGALLMTLNAQDPNSRIDKRNLDLQAINSFMGKLPPSKHLYPRLSSNFEISKKNIVHNNYFKIVHHYQANTVFAEACHYLDSWINAAQISQQIDSPQKTNIIFECSFKWKLEFDLSREPLLSVVSLPIPYQRRHTGDFPFISEEDSLSVAVFQNILSEKDSN